eukprot:3930003-Rhodomonas_salina.4
MQKTLYRCIPPSLTPSLPRFSTSSLLSFFHASATGVAYSAVCICCAAISDSALLPILTSIAPFLLSPLPPSFFLPQSEYRVEFVPREPFSLALTAIVSVVDDATAAQLQNCEIPIAVVRSQAGRSAALNAGVWLEKKGASIPWNAQSGAGGGRCATLPACGLQAPAVHPMHTRRHRLYQQYARGCAYSASTLISIQRVHTCSTHAACTYASITVLRRLATLCSYAHRGVQFQVSGTDAREFVYPCCCYPSSYALATKCLTSPPLSAPSLSVSFRTKARSKVDYGGVNCGGCGT